MTFIQKLLTLFKLENIEKKISYDSQQKILSSNKVAFFKNGQLYATQPAHLDNWYDVNYICSDSVYFNLENVHDIQKIPVPKFQTLNDFDNHISTGSLDYVLRMKAGKFYNTKQKELCSACLWKSTELMLHNDSFLWREYDYYRIVQWHLELGMFDEAKKAEYYLYTQLKKNKTYQQLISDIKHTDEYKKQQKEFFSKNQARKEYYQLVYLLPDIAPKSFSAYRRIKNQNTPRFSQIKEIAENNGIVIFNENIQHDAYKKQLSGYELELFARQCNYKLEHDDKLENCDSI